MTVEHTSSRRGDEMKTAVVEVTDLESWTDDDFGFRWDGEQTVLPDGECLAVCTNGARYVVSLIGRGKVFGFAEDENPGTAPGEIAFGHDFAVIDDRWIVDLWSKHFSGISDWCVFDLESDLDEHEIRRLFGDRSKWKLMSE